MKRKIFLRIVALAAILCIYPACVIIYTWSCVLKSDLEGGRNGKLDAYRHSLASATVAYTLGEWAVEITTWVFESGCKDSNKMDAHNNRIGAKIGSKATRFADIEPAVRLAVDKGQVAASDADQITWLPDSKWRDGKLW